MTSVRIYRGRRGQVSGFSVIGHAGSAPQGEDIVCAGLSALAQAAVNALETVAGIKTTPRIGEGFLSVRLPRGLTKRELRTARIILRTAEQGFIDIAAAYPHYVRVSR